jgi:hypothetical protein
MILQFVTSPAFPLVTALVPFAALGLHSLISPLSTRETHHEDQHASPGRDDLGVGKLAPHS